MEGPQGQVRAAWPSCDAKSHHLLCPTASSVSSFRINGNELVNGENTISLTITGESGVSSTSTLRVQNTACRHLYLIRMLNRNVSSYYFHLQTDPLHTFPPSLEHYTAVRSVLSLNFFPYSARDLLCYIWWSGCCNHMLKSRKQSTDCLDPILHQWRGQKDGWGAWCVHHGANSRHLFFPTASSVSSFRINGNELINGENTISLTITGESGVSRTSTLTLRRTVTIGRHLYVPDYKNY